MARVTKDALEGHCIYEGGFCKLHLTYPRYTGLNIKINNDGGRDYTLSNSACEPSILRPQPSSVLGSAATPSNSVAYPMSNQMMAPQAATSWNMVSGAGLPSFNGASYAAAANQI